MTLSCKFINHFAQIKLPQHLVLYAHEGEHDQTLLTYGQSQYVLESSSFLNFFLIRACFHLHSLSSSCRGRYETCRVSEMSNPGVLNLLEVMDPFEDLDKAMDPYKSAT